jgi:hypothetical protein
MKVLFETKKLQKSGSIAFRDQLLRNVGFQVGAAVDFFDTATRNVIVQRATTHSWVDAGRLKLTVTTRGGN